jgi:ATP-dependent Lon protease
MKLRKMYEMNTTLVEGELLGDMPVLPLRNAVLYPGSLMPLSVGRPKSLTMFNEVEAGSVIIVVTQHDAGIERPTQEEFFKVGTAARILEVYEDEDAILQVVVQGMERVIIKKMIDTDPFFTAQVELSAVPADHSVEVVALSHSLSQLANEYIEMISKFPASAFDLMNFADSPLYLAYTVVNNLPITIKEKQALLEESEPSTVMRESLKYLNGQIEALKVSQRINTEVTGELTKNQRDFFLRQQVKGIRKELGDEEDDEEFIDQIRLKLLEANLPEEAQKVANKEVKRLKNIQTTSPEYTVIRTYLECLADLPWSIHTEDSHDIENAQEILDREHYGLEKVKQRILEFLAVNSLRKDGRSPILCLVGPPGVGKTSLGKSIAEALNRKYQRISLGGVRDEAEIRGHRRTYIGSMPGKFIQTIKRAESSNPVLILDEIDKLGRDWRGDPTSALLEVLDPAQNSTFMDHYLDVPYDLSKVMFVATANSLEGIPGPLLDRMEMIDVSSYTVEEKTEIARRHLFPKQIKEHGLTEDQLSIQPEALQKVVINYTREAGVRNLERQLAKICRKHAVEVVKKAKDSMDVSTDDLDDMLGPVKHIPETAERTKMPGVSTGLAWTSVGGDILFIEATMSKNGKGKLKLTGNLGDVMKESVELAMSYLKANAEELNIDSDVFSEHDFHVHVPQGAIPKDGPSAGVTMISALTSLMTNVRVRGDIAMTGEMTLRGNVLPIGGLKEKVLAAHRAGITHVILPERNKKDIVDIPDSVRAEMTFHPVSQLSEVLEIALEKTSE